MATQLRAIVANEPATIEQSIDGLAFARSQLAHAIPEAESITFSFDDQYRLRTTIKTTKREDRASILFKLQNGMVRDLQFDKIVEGVETGSRRRLTITAEVC